MCGIAGVFETRAASGADLRNVAVRMCAVLAHRGPDKAAQWCEGPLAFAHRRLAILDLSAAGDQPMVSSDGRYVICYNGEVYNADAIRADLKGVCFRGHSDTEAVLESCARHGVPATLEKLIGMFAFALWDRTARRLWLVRDRLGIKPLYWSLSAGLLLFGSELKALRAHPHAPCAIDRNSVATFLRHGHVPAPHSIYRNVHKLLPGHMLCMEAGKDAPRISAYWSLADVCRRTPPFAGDETEALDALETLLADAVRRRMIADVPLGAFLSGGIDSSTVLAMMAIHGGGTARSFSIGFQEAGYDEARHAGKVAAHLASNHTELTVTAADAHRLIPDLPHFYDEPFADSSQVPTYLVSALARPHVTVALSGDGGDELFAGYNRHIQARRLSRIPGPVRTLAAGAIRALPVSAWERILPRLPLAGDKMDKLAAALAAGDAGNGAYRRLVSHWTAPEAVAIGGEEYRGVIWDEALAERIPDAARRMQYLDSLTYLPDDILTKLDRASMAVSLEARVPLLDHRLVAFAWSLPDHMKIRNGKGKWLLRRLLCRHVPATLVERPKRGFAIPVAHWLRGPLRGWAEALLDERVFARHDLLRRAPVMAKWCELLKGRGNWQQPVWNILALHAWAEAHHPAP